MEPHIYTSTILRGLYKAPNVFVKCSKNALIPDRVSSAPEWMCSGGPMVIGGTDPVPARGPSPAAGGARVLCDPHSQMKIAAMRLVRSVWEPCARILPIG